MNAALALALPAVLAALLAAPGDPAPRWVVPPGHETELLTRVRPGPSLLGRGWTLTGARVSGGAIELTYAGEGGAPGRAVLVHPSVAPKAPRGGGFAVVEATGVEAMWVASDLARAPSAFVWSEPEGSRLTTRAREELAQLDDHLRVAEEHLRARETSRARGRLDAALALFDKERQRAREEGTAATQLDDPATVERAVRLGVGLAAVGSAPAARELLEAVRAAVCGEPRPGAAAPANEGSADAAADAADAADAAADAGSGGASPANDAPAADAAPAGGAPLRSGAPPPDPRRVRALHCARANAGLGDAAAAVRLAAAARAADPRFAADCAGRTLGEELFRVGAGDAAIDVLDADLAGGCTEPAAFEALYLAYHDAAAYDRERALIDRWLAARPDDVHAARALARNRYDLGLHDEASAALERLERLDPRYPQLLSLLANAHLHLGPAARDATVARMTERVARDPKDAIAQFLLGVNDFYRGAYAAAMTHLEVAWESRRDEPRIPIYVGVSAFRLGDVATARRWIDEAAKIARDDPDVFYCRALVWRDDDPDAAALDLQRYLETTRPVRPTEVAPLPDKERYVRFELHALRVIGAPAIPWDEWPAAELRTVQSPLMAALAAALLAGAAAALLARRARRARASLPAAAAAALFGPAAYAARGPTAAGALGLALAAGCLTWGVARIAAVATLAGPVPLHGETVARTLVPDVASGLVAPYVLPAGLEPLLDEALKPELPGGLRFLGARVERDRVLARWERDADDPLVVSLHHPTRRAAGDLVLPELALRVDSPGGAGRWSEAMEALSARLRKIEDRWYWQSTAEGSARAPSSDGFRALRHHGFPWATAHERLRSWKLKEISLALAQTLLCLFALALPRLVRRCVASARALHAARPREAALAAAALVAGSVAAWLVPGRMVSVFFGYDLVEAAATLDFLTRYGPAATALYHALFALTPPDHAAVLALHAALAPLGLLLLGALAHRWLSPTEPRGVTAAALGLLALSPLLWRHWASESNLVPALVWLAAALVAWLAWLDDGDGWDLLGAVVSALLCTLTRVDAGLVGAVTLVAVTLTAPGAPAAARARWRAVLAMAVLAALALLPELVHQRWLLETGDPDQNPVASAHGLLGRVIGFKHVLVGLARENVLWRTGLFPVAATVLALVAPFALFDGEPAAVRARRRLALALLGVTAAWLSIYYLDFNEASLPRLQVPAAVFALLAAALGFARILHAAGPRAPFVGGLLAVTLLASQAVTLPLLSARTNSDQEDAFLREAVARLPPHPVLFVRLGYGEAPDPGVHRHYPDYLFHRPLRDDVVLGASAFRAMDATDWPVYFYFGMRCYAMTEGQRASAGGAAAHPECTEVLRRYETERVVEWKVPNLGELAFDWYPSKVRVPELRLALYRVLGPRRAGGGAGGRGASPGSGPGPGPGARPGAGGGGPGDGAREQPATEPPPVNP